MMQVVIMAGGKGTRIASVNSEVPKPMIPVLGKPVLEYQINAFKEQGYVDIILVVGDLGHIIRNYFGDGSRWGDYTIYRGKRTFRNSRGTILFERKIV